MSDEIDISFQDSDEEKKEKKRLYDIEYRKKNRERIKLQKKLWCDNNPDKVKDSRIRNKDSKKISDKNYSEKNRENISQYKKQWAKDNPDKVRSTNTKYIQNKRINDPLFKLKDKISSIIRDSLKRSGFKKNSRSIEILGCSIEYFKEYIESKFEIWMTWDNYGNPKDGIYEVNKTWDLDHIIPLRSGNTEEEIIKLNYYTNLQPLCSYNNRFIKK